MPKSIAWFQVFTIAQHTHCQSYWRNDRLKKIRFWIRKSFMLGKELVVFIVYGITRPWRGEVFKHTWVSLRNFEIVFKMVGNLLSHSEPRKPTCIWQCNGTTLYMSLSYLPTGDSANWLEKLNMLQFTIILVRYALEYLCPPPAGEFKRTFHKFRTFGMSSYLLRSNGRQALFDTSTQTEP